MSEKLKLGFIKDAHSIHGEVFLSFSGDESLIPEEITLIKKDGNASVYKVNDFRPHKNGYILDLDGVETRTEAEKLKGATFELSKDQLVSDVGEKPYLSELLGFTVVDNKNNQILGTVSSFDSNGFQDLAIVKGADSSFVFPFVEDLISDINYETKTISLLVHEGITEVSP